MFIVRHHPKTPSSSGATCYSMSPVEGLISHAAPTELRNVTGHLYYKHFNPTGLKTYTYQPLVRGIPQQVEASVDF